MIAEKKRYRATRPSHGGDFVDNPGQQKAPPGKLGRNITRPGEQLVMQRLQSEVGNEIARIATPAARLYSPPQRCNG